MKPVTGWVHPDRYSLSNVVSAKNGVVIHTSESGDNSLPSLVAFMGRPGDRPVEGSNPPRMYGSSYHAIADGMAGSYVMMQDHRRGPFSAPPLNKNWWHIVCPGRAAQTRAEWLDQMSRGQIRGCAQFIVDAWQRDTFELRHLSPAEVKAGGKGVIGHRDVTYAFQISGGHTDPGPEFPWDVLFDDVARLLRNPLEDDMVRIVRLANAGGVWVAPDQFVVTGGQIEHLGSLERRDALIAAGHAKINTDTGAPYKMDRSYLKYFRLVGTLPAGCTISVDEFLKD
jgi:hypothetical protein